jgi:hypothetical protein
MHLPMAPIFSFFSHIALCVFPSANYPSQGHCVSQ